MKAVCQFVGLNVARLNDTQQNALRSDDGRAFFIQEQRSRVSGAAHHVHVRNARLQKLFAHDLEPESFIERRGVHLRA